MQESQDTPNEKYLYRDLVLLYSPPKVGSTSIVSSIRISASEKFYVMHTHDEIIFKTTLGEQNNTCVSDIIKNTSIFNPNTKTARKVYVIDIYRQPIERKISEFFHEISTLHFNNTEDNILKYYIQKIQNRFNDIFPHLSNEDFYKERFDVEYPNTFDFEKKYLKYEKNGVTYIKLRLQDSQEWGNILSEILNNQIVIVKDYPTEDKKIGVFYKDFLREYKLPFNFYKMIRDCPHLNYYNTLEEKNDYLNGWLEKLTGLYNPYTTLEYKFYEKLCLENQFHFRPLFLHYRDDGCLCKLCSEKRDRVFFDIDNGNHNNKELIVHGNHQNKDVPQKNRIYLELHKDKFVSNVKGMFLDITL